MQTNIIYNGDCVEKLRDEKLFPDDSVNLIITSPPYADKRKNSYEGKHPDEYVEWFLQVSEQLKRILKDDGSFILNIKEHPREGEREIYVLELILALRKQGWFWIEEYCWYKKNSFPGKWSNRFRDSWERCYHFAKKKKFKMFQDEVKVPIGDWAAKRFKSMSENDFIRHSSGNNKHLGRNVSNWLDKQKVNPHNVLIFEEEHYPRYSNLIELATECGNRRHSAVFPIELPSWFIVLFSEKNDVILDPFMGSGTTALASILLERKYIGVELKEEYFKESELNIKGLKKDRKKKQLVLFDE
jgi:site-specific DNA-methyltransferase (adenine-specific)